MHYKVLDQQTILETKKQLVQAIIDANFDLQEEKVLLLSKRLDELMLPVFKSQLDFYNEYLNLSHHYMA
nr:Spo0E family sporulation regulatory protein-aspartic acid phosphatase [uncultured Niameybacter sp.]